MGEGLAFLLLFFLPMRWCLATDGRGSLYSFLLSHDSPGRPSSRRREIVGPVLSGPNLVSTGLFPWQHRGLLIGSELVRSGQENPLLSVAQEK